jgi:hypothetical protein
MFRPEKLSPSAQACEAIFSPLPIAMSSLSLRVMVQCAEDPYYFCLFGLLLEGLRKRRSVRASQLVMQSIRVGDSPSLLRLASSLLYPHSKTRNTWVALYQRVAQAIAWRSADWPSLTDIVDALHALRIWRGVQCVDQLASLTLRGIHVGDLIIDSYLRFKPSACVVPSDPYVAVVIWQALRDLRKGQRYFRRQSPHLFLSSYSTYVQHGIPARLAVKMGIPVFTLGNYQQLVKPLQPEDTTHSTDHRDYAKMFSRLTDPASRLAVAEKALRNRLAGGVDAATAYMRQSAYASLGEPLPDMAGTLVMFLHDFFDSPHTYRWLVFHDFMEWVTHTIALVEQHGLKLAIKPHPNQLPESACIFETLKRQHPSVTFLSPKVTNRQLFDAGMTCGLSVYGTVVHELGYLGVPTICCGDNPHISFTFNDKLTARTRAEYDQLVVCSSSLLIDKAAMREQCLAFYYMHNLYQPEEERQLMDAVAILRNRFYMNPEPPVTHEELNQLLDSIRHQPGFIKALDTLEKHLQLAS